MTALCFCCCLQLLLGPFGFSQLWASKNKIPSLLHRRPEQEVRKQVFISMSQFHSHIHRVHIKALFLVLYVFLLLKTSTPSLFILHPCNYLRKYKNTAMITADIFQGKWANRTFSVVFCIRADRFLSFLYHVEKLSRAAEVSLLFPTFGQLRD